MSTSVREYAVLYLGGKKTSGGASAGGGNVMLGSGPHALDGPEHTGQLPLERISTDVLDPTWHVVADGLGGLELVPDLGGSGGSGGSGGGGDSEPVDGTTPGSVFFGPLMVNDPNIVTTNGEAVYLPLVTMDGQPIFIEYAAP